MTITRMIKKEDESNWWGNYSRRSIDLYSKLKRDAQKRPRDMKREERN